MRITNKIQLNTQPSNLNFKSNKREVVNKANHVVNRNTTMFFRDDIKWDLFINGIINKFKNAGKVNIYDYACSDGSEAYTLAMLLIKKLGKEKAQKFFPIKASDIDEEILKNPKNRIVNLSSGDMCLIEWEMGDKTKDFIKFDRIFQDGKYCKGEVMPLLQETVVFENKNIVDDIKNVKNDNSIIMCRNFWPYLLKSEREKLVDDIASKLGDNSICIVGDFDNQCNLKSYFSDRNCINPLDNKDDEATILNKKFCFVKDLPSKHTQLRDKDYLMSVYANKR